MNARSVANKYNKFASILKNHNPELVGVTESWLQPEVKFNLPGYVTFRCDRSSKGGGVLLCVKPSLKPTFIKDYRIGMTEILIISILNNFGVILVYRPPNAPQSDLLSLVNFLEIEIASFQKYCVTGDLNLPLIDWQTYSTTDPRSKIFLDFCNDHSLIQFVDFPTRSTNILDLILSPNNNIFSVKSLPPLGASDHSIVSYCIDETTNECFEPFYIYDYHRADYELINAFLLTIDCSKFFNGCSSTSEYWTRFNDLLMYIQHEFIPTRMRPVSSF